MKTHLNIIPGIFLYIPLLVMSCNSKGKEEHAGHQEKQVQHIELEALLRPANAFVISTVPVTTIEQREQDAELAVVGTVGYDTRQLGAVSSRIGGRIEKLYARYKYQRVKKGQRIMDIYSPELMTAQQNLLFLIRNDPENSSFIEAARERLVLLGMSAAQVEEVARSGKPKQAIAIYSNYSGFVTDAGPINTASTGSMESPPANTLLLSIKEGTYVQPGQPVFSIYNSDAAWILLDIFPEQQNSLKIGDAVRIVPETAPGKNFRAKIDYLEPVFRPGNKTLTARVYFDNSSLALPIGSRVTANIFSSTINAGWLPKESVLSLGRDKIVFKKEPGGFRAHKVVTGLEVNGLVQITAGINRADSVAVNAQYLVDNEAFIKVNQK